MLLNSTMTRTVSMSIGTPLLSRIQTKGGEIVRTSATARSRNTPLPSLAGASPSWLDSISANASALPVASGLNELVCPRGLWPCAVASAGRLAVSRLTTRKPSSSAKRRQST